MNLAVPLWSERPDRLLVAVARPGDAERVMGGSVARWVAAGAVAWLVCGTSADASADDPSADPLALAGQHEREQREAAVIIGYEEVTFLHRPEGALVNDLALREQLVRLIRAFRPDTIAAVDPRVLVRPDGRLSHVDQRDMGEAALDALRPAANALAFPQLQRSEGLTPHVVRRLLLYEPQQPSAAVDVTDVLELKLRAAGVHSHVGDPFSDRLEQVRARAQHEGQLVGVAAAEHLAVIEPLRGRG